MTNFNIKFDFRKAMALFLEKSQVINNNFA